MALEKHFEEDDPYALVGMGFPCPEGFDATEEMARTFIEEYALMGFPPELILKVFQNRHYQGPYGVLRSRGEEYVRGLIGEVMGEDERDRGTQGIDDLRLTIDDSGPRNTAISQPRNTAQPIIDHRSPITLPEAPHA